MNKFIQIEREILNNNGTAIINAGKIVQITVSNEKSSIVMTAQIIPTSTMDNA